MTRKTVAVCADDYGASEGVDAAILELARAGRLSAFTCLVNGARWPTAAAAATMAMRDLPERIEVGLHLDFTEGTPCSAELARHWPSLPSLPALMLRAALGRLPLAAVRAEVRAQHAAFVDAFGRAPDFIDGHQHVHHLPGLRDVVLEFASACPLRPPLRATGRVCGPGHRIKCALIEASGGRALMRELRRRGWPHNVALLGVYDFGARDYRSLMRGWLASAPVRGALLLCHPARAAEPDDPIGPARVRELAYLASPAFGADLAEAGVVLGAAWLPVSESSSGG